MSDSTVPSDPALQRAVTRLRRRGYAVHLQPSNSSLPAQLQGFQPDFLASKGRHRIFVQVLGQEDTKRRRALPKLAEAISQLRNWDAEFIMRDPNALRSGSAKRKPISIQQLPKVLAMAEQLRKAGSLEQSILVGWSGLEGVLRNASDKIVRGRTDLPPHELFKTLVSDGVLTDSEFKFLLSAMELRNGAVHGFRLPTLRTSRVKSILQRFERLAHAVTARIVNYSN